ncbi:MAG: PilZ domain-containing protein [Bdellovibrionia bacterium]
MTLTSAPANTRRKFPRRLFKSPVGVLSRGVYFVADAGELGEGGMSFATDMVVPEGSQIIISFQIPHGDFVCVRAIVRSLLKNERSHVMTHGVSFENLSFANKRQIRAFVSARTVDQSESAA